MTYTQEVYDALLAAGELGTSISVLQKLHPSDQETTRQWNTRAAITHLKSEGRIEALSDDTYRVIPGTEPRREPFHGARNSRLEAVFSVFSTEKGPLTIHAICQALEGSPVYPNETWVRATRGVNKLLETGRIVRLSRGVYSIPGIEVKESLSPVLSHPSSSPGILEEAIWNYLQTSRKLVGASEMASALLSDHFKNKTSLRIQITENLSRMIDRGKVTRVAPGQYCLTYRLSEFSTKVA